MSPGETPTPLQALARELARRKTRRLIGRDGLNEQDAEDLEQELLLRLRPLLERYNPTRGDPRAFLAAAIHKHLNNLLRNRRAVRRDYRRTRSLDVRADRQAEGTRADSLTEQAHEPRLGPHGHSAEEQADLALDVADVLARLPEAVRAACRQVLVSGSVAAAARELGMSRSTLQDWMRRLRERFEQAGLDVYL
jgi:RNA polymerase sigma factor (sigma-70 family)